MTGAHSSDEDHGQYIDQLIMGSGAQSLNELASCLPGVYPTELVDRVRSLAPRLGRDAADRLLAYAPDIRELEVFESSLPLPHPLDFEWRFTRQSCSDLMQLAAAPSRPAGKQRVALFGTPHLGEHIANQKSSLHAVLYERRAEACNRLKGTGSLSIRQVDLAVVDAEDLNDPFDVVIADPPWYPAVTQVFIHAAARALRLGGRLMLCVPGLGTRPSAADERFQLTEFCHEHGLAIQEVHPLRLEYESPPFEIAALGAAGLERFNSRWRRGDLLIFTKLGQPRRFSPDVDIAVANPWKEVVVGDARIRVNQVVEYPDGQPLQSLVPGDVLDSVSRRDMRRDEPNVWTTSNRVYATSSPSHLLSALELMHEPELPASSSPEIAAAARIIIEAEQAFLATLRNRNPLC